MITRAQAEALLTLAESLEACERLGLTVEVCSSYDGSQIIQFHDSSQPVYIVSALTGMKVRLAVNALGKGEYE